MTQDAAKVTVMRCVSCMNGFQRIPNTSFTSCLQSVNVGAVSHIRLVRACGCGQDSQDSQDSLLLTLSLPANTSCIRSLASATISA